MSKKYDTDLPILIIVKKGRRGRGFQVSPVEDAENPSMCQGSQDLGELIEEMVNDESQPRVDLKQMFSPTAVSSYDASQSNGGSKQEQTSHQEDEDGQEDAAGKGGIFEGVSEAEDPADQLLVNAFSWVVNKGQSMSTQSKPRRRRRRVKTRAS